MGQQGPITMSHQRRAKSWLSFPHTLKDFIMMQGEETLCARNNYEARGCFVMFVRCRFSTLRRNKLLTEPLFECVHQEQIGLCGYLFEYGMCVYVTQRSRVFCDVRPDYI